MNVPIRARLTLVSTVLMAVGADRRWECSSTVALRGRAPDPVDAGLRSPCRTDRRCAGRLMAT